jgi:hypothetical protein
MPKPTQQAIDIHTITMTEVEFVELRILLSQEIQDTVSNRKARIWRNLLTKMAASVPETLILI